MADTETDEAALTPAQRRLARHALGLPNRRRISYRNHYVAPYVPGGPFDVWNDMVCRGLADSISRRGTVRFWLTRLGATLALEPGERLCPEEFPDAGT